MRSDRVVCLRVVVGADPYRVVVCFFGHILYDQTVRLRADYIRPTGLEGIVRLDCRGRRPRRPVYVEFDQIESGFACSEVWANNLLTVSPQSA